MRPSALAFFLPSVQANKIPVQTVPRFQFIHFLSFDLPKRLIRMKSPITVIFFLVFSATAFSQPTIQNMENFSIGTVLKFKECNSAGVNAGPSGASVTWDFSSLTLLPDTTTELIIAPSEAPHDSLFPSANMVEKYSDGRYVYFEKTSTENKLHGFADDGSGFLIKYPNSMLFARRPITYQDSISDIYTTSFTSSGFDFRGQGTATIEADGYGTLILPNDTYNNVLRVKITQSQVDTIIQFGSTYQTNTETYAWFDGTHNSALLKIDSTISPTFQQKSVSYLLSETTSGIHMVNRSGLRLKIFPNPAADEISFNAPEQGSITVLNVLGRIIYQGNVPKGQSTVQTNQFPSGIYTLVYGAGESFVSETFLIRR
jgi:hypothetical protein